MKQPTQREARELASKSKSDGTMFIVMFNASGKPSISAFRPVTRAQAHEILRNYITPKGSK